jgi:hypothetical protein
MTDTPEPAAEGDAPPAAPSAQADAVSDRRRRSVWGSLNRTNRIAALVLGGVAAVVAAVLIFGAGLLVGAEFGDSEGHHDGVGTSEYGDGGRAGEHDGNDGQSADDGDSQDNARTDGERDSGQGDAQERSGAPEGQAPGGSTGAPRP